MGLVATEDRTFEVEKQNDKIFCLYQNGGLIEKNFDGIEIDSYEIVGMIWCLGQKNNNRYLYQNETLITKCVRKPKKW